MIRILHSVSNMDRAGIETMLMNYYRHIDRSKIQFDFLCNKKKPGAYDAEIKEMGGNIYHTPGLNPAKYPSYLKCMKKIFEENPEYNGEKYLPELLESVLAQKDIYVDILARDDGSTDKTVEILKKYDRVKVYGGNNLKPAKSFLDLIWKADINYDYYALCDQDDVWKEEKIISAVKCIENIDKPALYSSAVEVVDKDLTFIRKSFTDNTFKNPLYDIHHIAIIVSDYEVAKDFYVNKLGFSVIRENYRPERKDWKLDLRVNEHTELEIFVEKNPPKRVNRPEACGLRHLAFCVESVEQTVKELAEVGIECEPIRVDDYTGKKMTFFHDPDGLPLELHE